MLLRMRYKYTRVTIRGVNPTPTFQYIVFSKKSFIEEIHSEFYI